MWKNQIEMHFPLVQLYNHLKKILKHIFDLKNKYQRHESGKTD